MLQIQPRNEEIDSCHKIYDPWHLRLILIIYLVYWGLFAPLIWSALCLFTNYCSQTKNQPIHIDNQKCVTVISKLLVTETPSVHT